MSGILIAGTSSGCGKTTVSIGIMSALNKKGLKVLPFKVGPDYIDPKFHEFVTGNPSYNLDGFMLNEEALKYVYHIKTDVPNSIKVVEGVMGMYDGYGIVDAIGSSSHIAKILNLPVVLVIDASGMSLSSAAMVYGFAKFDQDLNIAGVVVNKVSGEAHYNMVKKAIELNTGIPCLGYLKKSNEFNLKSRHLGLVPANEVDSLRDKVNTLSEMVQDTIELDEIINISRSIKDNDKHRDTSIDQFIEQNKSYFKGKNICVAYSNAFSFYYQSNIDLLNKLGAKISFVNPEKDEKLSDSIDSLYIGGGYPEIFAEELSQNKCFMADLRKKLDQGLKCYAECGGLMYLSNSITTLDGRTLQMVGFVDAHAIMTKRLQRFGYIEVDFEGTKMNCHEFHRSKLYKDDKLNYIFNISKCRDGELIKKYRCGARVKNSLCGYPHVHFMTNLEFVRKVF